MFNFSKKKGQSSFVTEGPNNPLGRPYSQEPAAVFGCPLESQIISREHGIPKFLHEWCEIVRNYGLGLEGIFRLSVDQGMIDEKREKYNRSIPVELTSRDSYLASVLIKLFLRELPESIVPFSMFDDIVDMSLVDDKVEEMRELFESLPPLNYNILRHICTLVDDLLAHSKDNKMKLSSFVVVLSPNIMWSKDTEEANGVSAEINFFFTEFFKHYKEILKELKPLPELDIKTKTETAIAESPTVPTSLESGVADPAGIAQTDDNKRPLVKSVSETAFPRRAALNNTGIQREFASSVRNPSPARAPSPAKASPPSSPSFDLKGFGKKKNSPQKKDVFALIKEKNAMAKMLSEGTLNTGDEPRSSFPPTKTSTEPSFDTSNNNDSSADESSGGGRGINKSNKLTRHGRTKSNLDIFSIQLTSKTSDDPKSNETTTTSPGGVKGLKVDKLNKHTRTKSNMDTLKTQLFAVPKARVKSTELPLQQQQQQQTPPPPQQQQQRQSSKDSEALQSTETSQPPLQSADVSPTRSSFNGPQQLPGKKTEELLFAVPKSRVKSVGGDKTWDLKVEDNKEGFRARSCGMASASKTSSISEKGKDQQLSKAKESTEAKKETESEETMEVNEKEMEQQHKEEDDNKEEIKKQQKFVEETKKDQPNEAEAKEAQTLMIQAEEIIDDEKEEKKEEKIEEKQKEEQKNNMEEEEKKQKQETKEEVNIKEKETTKVEIKEERKKSTVAAESKKESEPDQPKETEETVKEATEETAAVEETVEEMKARIKEEMKKEMEDKMKADMREKMKEDMKRQMKQQMEEEMKRKLEEEIKQELIQKMKEELEAEIVQELQQEEKPNKEEQQINKVSIKSEMNDNNAAEQQQQKQKQQQQQQQQQQNASSTPLSPLESKKALQLARQKQLKERLESQKQTIKSHTPNSNSNASLEMFNLPPRRRRSTVYGFDYDGSYSDSEPEDFEVTSSPPKTTITGSHILPTSIFGLRRPNEDPEALQNSQNEKERSFSVFSNNSVDSLEDNVVVGSAADLEAAASSGNGNWWNLMAKLANGAKIDGGIAVIYCIDQKIGLDIQHFSLQSKLMWTGITRD